MRIAAFRMVLLSSAWNSAAGADDLTGMEWNVEGLARGALVFVPMTATTTPSPVVFALHGHGGMVKYFAQSVAYHKHWPKAIVVYMQGVNTPGVI